jgi:hypothetical protein
LGLLAAISSSDGHTAARAEEPNVCERPDNNPAQQQYVCRVIANMVASGFGAWTATARTFCNKPAP